MGTGEAQPAGPYAAGIGRQLPAGNGTYGAPPSGFEGMASPYYQSTGGAPGKTELSTAAFTLTLVLRIVAAVLSLLALALIASANKSNTYYTSTSTTYYWQHWNMKALRLRSSQFLLALGVIVAIYEIVQICFAYMQRAGGMSCMSDTAGTLFTFILDQLLAYLMFSASTMSVDDSASRRHGEGSDKYGDCSSEWNSYCIQTEAGGAFGIFAFGALAALAYMSVCRYVLLARRS